MYLEKIYDIGLSRSETDELLSKAQNIGESITKDEFVSYINEKLLDTFELGQQHD